MYFTDRGIEELLERRGDESVTFEWLTEAMLAFIDTYPEFAEAVDSFATWLARPDDDPDV
jgi:hypothetical protein